MQLIIDIKNEELANKIIWFLKSFKDKGVEILNYKTKDDDFSTQEWDEEFAKKHWREIIMGTHSSSRDDDEYLYEAAKRFYDEKYSD